MSNELYQLLMKHDNCIVTYISLGKTKSLGQGEPIFI